MALIVATFSKASRAANFASTSSQHGIGRRPTLISWRTPSHGWIKVNIDYSFKSDVVGIGGLFRDTNRKCLVFLASPCNAYTPLESETYAVLAAMQVAIYFHLSNVVIEIDSKSLFNILTGNLMPNWYLITLLKPIKTIVEINHLNIQYKFIHREGYCSADWLAKRGQTGIVIGFNPPLALYILMHGDLIEAPFIRA
ncbi:uncharacterized protein LOC110022495 [Phalaenopsis equestris]|uniref:uncharacterized protein LOC110022495 n=1 Tax=Phalaenopsis equestris TaxID=78828 RepID=UPI0009E2C90B|nr:uncharacterized protein LOC110022495 [Phalaenopsis equestris]